MPAVFLSHTSIDKPFVEKIASDLKRLGIEPWVDKYEIKVGESIFWRVEEGLKESEYFAIVLSPEALKSEWVKSEISAAWDKKLMNGKNAILPLLYHDCEIPVLLKSLKYADFRQDYQTGFSELAAVFGISEIDAITEDNWRLFARKKGSDWKRFRELEFQKFVTELCDLARRKRFSVWVGGTNRPFAVAISASWSKKMGHYRETLHLEDFGVRMNPKQGYEYYYAAQAHGSPRHIPLANFDTRIGATVDEAMEFISAKMDDCISAYGEPDSDTYYLTERLDKLRQFNPTAFMDFLVEHTDWDQGKLSK